MRDLSNDTRLLAVNSATVKAWSLSQLVEGCQRAGIPAIAPWRDIVQAVGIDKAGKLIRDASLEVSCLCRGGMFPAADEAGRRAALDDNRRAVDEAVGHRREVPGADRRRAAERIERPRRRARAGARRHRGAAALRARRRHAARHRAAAPDDRRRSRLRQHAGSRQRSLRRTGRGARHRARRLSRLVGSGIAAADRARGQTHHHLSRLRLAGADARPGVRPRHAGRRRDRPAHIRGMVEATGYAGHIDVEIFSTLDWWKREPDEVLRICKERHRSVV